MRALLTLLLSLNLAACITGDNELEPDPIEAGNDTGRPQDDVDDVTPADPDALQPVIDKRTAAGQLSHILDALLWIEAAD